jgi:hypothetical protein
LNPNGTDNNAVIGKTVLADKSDINKSKQSGGYNFHVLWLGDFLGAGLNGKRQN